MSRSPKVRKAVASNPNASAKVLRAAARLYLEEVLENPGFEMLKLFDDDKWVAKIGEIHDNPGTWVSGIGYFSRATDVLEPFARAALLSPALHVSQLATILDFLPVSSLKRAFKHPKTKNKIYEMVWDAPYDLTYEGLFKAYNAELYDEMGFFECLKKSASIGSMSCRKSTYTRTVRALLKKFEANEFEAGSALSVILLSSRASCVNWVQGLFGDTHLPIIAGAIHAAKKAGKPQGRKPSGPTKSIVRQLTSIISSIVWYNLDFEGRKTSLSATYKRLCQLGLEGHAWGDSKQTSPYAIQLTNQLAYELEKEPINVKAFYVRAKCLGTWFHVQKSDAKYRIVDEVNQWLYERGGVDNMIYKSIPINKVISISEDTIIAL